MIKEGKALFYQPKELMKKDMENNAVCHKETLDKIK
jgi:hypothetical protein